MNSTCADDIRAEAVLRHFASRAQQPRLLAFGPRTCGVTPPVQVIIAYDQGFGAAVDELDCTRFRYTGTSSQVSRDERINARRMMQESMYDSMRI